MTVPVVLEEFINRFKGWISGSGDLTELVGAFSSLSTYTIIAFVAIGLSLLIFGKKLFAVFYAVLWTVIGSHVGYLWGQGMETLYTVELMILIGILLPLVAIKAREIFVFTMVLLGTGFFATYITQSLGAFQSLTILDPPFVLAGCLFGWLAVKFMDYVMIVSTSLVGAFLLMLAVSYFFRDITDLLTMLLVFLATSLFGIFLQMDIYLRNKKGHKKKKTVSKGAK